MAYLNTLTASLTSYTAKHNAATTTNARQSYAAMVALTAAQINSYYASQNIRTAS